MLPTRTDLDWEGWKPGERYTYTIKVNEADIYIELDEIQANGGKRKIKKILQLELVALNRSIYEKKILHTDFNSLFVYSM